MIRFAAQPPIGVDDIGLDVLHAQPPRKPEAVAAGFKGNSNSCELASGFDCLVSPTTEQFKKGIFIGIELLQRCRSAPGTIPATGQLDRLTSTTAISVLF
jgi:hypothetical protein